METTLARDESGRSSLSSEALYLVALTVLTVVLRVAFWSRPLDMDEGLYAYGGWQMLHGLVPYRDLYDFKPPGVFFVDALLFALFGPEALSIYAGASAITAATTLGVYAVARKVWDRSTALVCGLLFAVYSSSPHVQGGGVNTEVFMVAPLVWGLYFALKGARGKGGLMAVSGLLFGAAALFKQVAGVGLAVGLLAVVLGNGLKEWRRWLPGAALVCAGFVLPWALCAGYFFWRDALKEFLFWVFQYPFLYMGYTRAAVQGVDIVGRILWILQGTLLLWLFTGAGIWSFRKKPTWSEGLLVLFLLLNCVGVAAGSNFFPHYFIQLTPALALLAGCGIVWFFRYARMKRSVAVTGCLAVLLAAGCLVHGFTHARVYTSMSGDELSEYESRWARFGSVFVAAKKVGLQLRKITDPSQEVFVWKHHPEINFYALRRTPSRAPIVSLPHLRQEELLLYDVERRRPEYVVILDSLPMRNDSLARIFINEYVKVYGINGLPAAHQGIYVRKQETR